MPFNPPAIGQNPWGSDLLATLTDLDGRVLKFTAAGATASNPTLASGQLGVETDTFKIKVGNGTTVWNLLPYATGGVINEATSIRMRAPDGGLWDFTAANDGVPVTTAVAAGGAGAVDAIRLTSPSGAVWVYTVANDGVFVFNQVIL